MGRFSGVFKAVCDRLADHTGDGQLLSGVKFNRNPTKEITGVKDLPAVRMMPPGFEELPRLVALSDGPMEMVLDVHTARGGNAEVEDHLVMVEKVCDALDRDGATLDLLLAGKLQKSMELKALDIKANTDVSLFTQLRIKLYPKTCLRGKRNE